MAIGARRERADAVVVRRLREEEVVRTRVQETRFEKSEGGQKHQQACDHDGVGGVLGWVASTKEGARRRVARARAPLRNTHVQLCNLTSSKETENQVFGTKLFPSCLAELIQDLFSDLAGAVTVEPRRTKVV